MHVCSLLLCLKNVHALILKILIAWISLVVQWLRLCAPKAGGTGSIPGQEAKILHAVGMVKIKIFLKNANHHLTMQGYHTSSICKKGTLKQSTI